MTKSFIKKFIIAFWASLVGSLLLLFLLFFGISQGWFGALPTFEELENPSSNLATEVYSADGVLMGKYYSQNRSNAHFDELPDNLVNALIATEDERYYGHTGIDKIAIARVAIGILTGTRRGGGSTISQQLAKNLFPRERLSKVGLVIRKFKEWIIAVKLEKAYTKEEIITMYLNTVEFSDNAFGIKSAAKTYFNTATDSLSVEESAVLIGMLQAPYRFNPRLHHDASKSRRNEVYLKMKHNSFLSESTYDSLVTKDIALDFTRTDHIAGPAPYFRENLRMYLKEWCENNRKADGSKYDIYKDGLKVYTTLDYNMQIYAEEAVAEHLSEMQDEFFKHWKDRDPWKDYEEEFDRIYTNNPEFLAMRVDSGYSRELVDSLMAIPRPMKVFTWQGEKDTILSPIDSIRMARMHLQCGFMAMEPESGYIRAWVGGINYKYFKYDHVNKNTKRQVGSTFKPFVYAAAIMNNHYSPCYKMPNELVTFEKEDDRWNLIKDWTPKNADNKYGGMLSLKQGLAYSVNTITARLMHELSPETVISLVKQMGIESEIEAYPSICLGTPDISLYEMVGAYTSFVNKGFYTEPIFISRIEDKNGNLIQNFLPIRNEVMDEQTAYIMLQLLKNVVSEGTGIRLRYKYDLKNDIVGKTGTTQNHSDGWFIGLTPELIAGVWVGCEDRFVRFRSIRLGQGASTALPIWAKFFQKVYADESIELDLLRKFEKPSGDLTVELDCPLHERELDQTIDAYGSEYDLN